MPKITEKDLGNKMKEEGWEKDYFIPLIFCSNKTEIIGILYSAFHGKEINFTLKNTEYWLPYEEPNKKVTKRMAPALIGSDTKKLITSVLFESEENAKRLLDGFIKWPASESMWVEIEVEE